MKNALAQFLAARPEWEYLPVGAHHAKCLDHARATSRGEHVLLELDGPHGAGKSELLRQFALQLHGSEFQLLPIYVDLSLIHETARPGDLRSNSLGLTRLLGSALRQVLAGSGRIDMLTDLWLEHDGARLAGACYGLGLRSLVPFSGNHAIHAPASQVWAAFLNAVRQDLTLPPFLLIDGSQQHPELLRPLLDAVRNTRCAAIYEQPPASEALEWGAAARFGLEPLDLEALGSWAARRLARRGLRISEAGLVQVLERLGPWPGPVQQYLSILVGKEYGGSERRMLEECYLDLVTTGDWARRIERGLTELVTPAQRIDLIRLLDSAFQHKQPIGMQEFRAVLGETDRGVLRIMDRLEYLGALRREGAGWRTPDEGIFGEWVQYQCITGDHVLGGEAARLRMMGRLLSRPVNSAAFHEPLKNQAVSRVLKRFQRQNLPEVLFRYHDYIEAIGRIPKARRRDLVENSTQRILLPEVVGVASWQAPQPSAPRLFYALAYRDSKYQRSHEETWLIADLTDSRMMTTAELHRALDSLDVLERRLAPARFVRWLLIGESASVEAVEHLKHQQVYCSNLEQFAFVSHDLGLKLEINHGTTPEPAPAAESEQAETPQENIRPKASVVLLDEWEAQPAAETRKAESTAGAAQRNRNAPEPKPGTAATQRNREMTRIQLPAHPDSERTAALLADRVALAAGFSAADVGRIRTAVLEGVLNAVEHSSDSEKSIDVQLIVTPEGLEIAIENEGDPFDPLAVPDPDPQKKVRSENKRGWGIALMKRFMDEVSYQTVPHGTQLRMKKRRTQDGPGENQLKKPIEVVKQIETVGDSHGGS